MSTATCPCCRSRIALFCWLTKTLGSARHVLSALSSRPPSSGPTPLGRRRNHSAPPAGVGELARRSAPEGPGRAPRVAAQTGPAARRGGEHDRAWGRRWDGAWGSVTAPRMRQAGDGRARGTGDPPGRRDGLMSSCAPTGRAPRRCGGGEGAAHGGPDAPVSPQPSRVAGLVCSPRRPQR
jgi:hypothetical protein